MKENRNNNHFEKDQFQRNTDASPRKTSRLRWKRVNKIARMAGEIALSLAAACCAVMFWPQSTMAKESGIDMYRLYNPNSGEHFYTASGGERDSLIHVGWQYEGTGWVAVEKGDPVYRLYNPNAGDHHYTLNSAERDMLVDCGWKAEGVGWYSDPAKTLPVYREYNPNAISGAHNYTTDLNEHEHLINLGWRNENIGWYALAPGKAVVCQGLSQLHVSGTDLLDENNRKVVLQGYSTFGLNYAPQYVDESVFRFLKNEMHSQIIRLALYTEEYGGYCNGGNQAQLEALIDKGVQAAKATGQYVIIDWHILSDGNPNTHLEEAKAFFAKMSARYKNEKHVIYEICNEPNGVSWDQIRSYAQQVIPVIRANDPKGIILVGTPTWSQDVDIAASNPLTGVTNVMYTLHFYAATHKEGIRDKLKTAHAKGLPVFVSEFGISSADGNGSLDEASGNAWMSLLNEYGISRVGWAVNNKAEASSLFLPGTSTALSLNDLSPSGRWFEETYQKNYKPLPGICPAPDQGQDAPSNPSTPTTPNTPPTQPSDPSQSTATSGSLRQTVTLKNHWTSNDQNFWQYEIQLTNMSSTSLSDWMAAVTWNQPVTIDQSWNGQYSINGSTLTIRPVPYNGTIAPGQSLTDLGIIVKTPASSKNLSIQ